MPNMDAVSSGRSRRDAVRDALLDIVATRGLDQVSVREVANEAGVSIGTVQHYFSTKDDMLTEAFEEVVRRIRDRIGSVRLTSDVRRNLGTVLRELLPLDSRRASEVRIVLAFAARAATAPRLAAVQRTVLTELRAGVAEGFASAGAGSPARCAQLAGVAVAAADGLALHAVSSPDLLSPRRMTASLDVMLDALLALSPPAAPSGRRSRPAVGRPARR